MDLVHPAALVVPVVLLQKNLALVNLVVPVFLEALGFLVAHLVPAVQYYLAVPSVPEAQSNLEVRYRQKFRSFRPILNYPVVLEVPAVQLCLEVQEVLEVLVDQPLLKYLQIPKSQPFR